MNRKRFITGLVIGMLILTACTPATVSFNTHEQKSSLSVVATTSIVGDVVRQVGGDLVNVNILLPIGSDPHSYQPSPQDVAKISEATLVFANGAGLEEFLQNLIESAGAADRLVNVSEGIELKDFGAHEHEHEGEDEQEHEMHSHEGGDPHTWVDPNNVIIWVQNIETKLSQIDSVNSAIYQTNAENYIAQLKELDAWIREQVKAVPDENRRLVTDHMVFGYFAERYGFEQIGAAIPGYSTLASPSAQDIAQIEDAIREFGVKAIFVGKTVNPTIAQRIAEDTGIKLVFVYHGSLSEAGGPAASYLDYMRYNVSEIVNALK
jgi:manganese/iron transport system substrate-binding protein